MLTQQRLNIFTGNRGARARSIRNNTYKDIEVIVVDNHSTDGTVKEIRSKFPWVKLIVMPDSSYGACEEFNIGFANAIGKYIAVLDDDSMLPPNWIENAIKKFEGEPEDVAVLATKIVEPSGLSWPSKDKMNKEFYCGFFSGAGAIIRRCALNLTRGYPKEYFIFGNEDELAAQFLSKGYKIKYFPEITTYHRFGSGYRKSSSRLAKKSFYYYMRNRLWTIWMHESRSRLIKKTIGHLYIYFLRALKYRYAATYVKALIDAIRGLPYCVKHREVVTSPYWRIKAQWITDIR